MHIRPGPGLSHLVRPGSHAHAPTGGRKDARGRAPPPPDIAPPLPGDEVITRSGEVPICFQGVPGSLGQSLGTHKELMGQRIGNREVAADRLTLACRGTGQGGVRVCRLLSFVTPGCRGPRLLGLRGHQARQGCRPAMWIRVQQPAATLSVTSGVANSQCGHGLVHFDLPRIAALPVLVQGLQGKAGPAQRDPAGNVGCPVRLGRGRPVATGSCGVPWCQTCRRCCSPCWSCRQRGASPVAGSRHTAPLLIITHTLISTHLSAQQGQAGTITEMIRGKVDVACYTVF